MEIAIVVIVVFVVLLLVIIAAVRFCNKLQCACCDSGDESIDDQCEEGHETDVNPEEEGMGEEDMMDDDNEEQVYIDEDIVDNHQIVVDGDGEEFVINKMEESLL